MSTVSTILADAARLANWRNDEVLERAARTAGITCPNCNYPQNASMFADTLRQYIITRCSRHHYLRVYERSCDHPLPVRFQPGSATDLKLRAFPLFQSFLKWDGFSQGLRYKLSQIWPCLQCRLRFNPTKRRRWGAFVMPQELSHDDFLEELLDV